jgi:AhpD family alkylhydroperoxidase
MLKMENRNIMGEVMDTMNFAGKILPEIQQKFMDFNKAVLSEGKLSVKTKELIAIALSLGNCEWCITYHTRMALSNGATEEEIMEAAYVAVLMAGAPALMHVQILKDALKGR